ncbi:MAG: HDOD domain-containing protein [Betaproteobacteria bacterium]|nr:HDOD domain-containing protein [Betaproteobacteria bacterium]
MMFAELPRDKSAWVRALDAVEIPVLRRTVEELARLREHEERVVARDIARVLLHDPMFTLRVLRYLQAHRRAAQISDITTVEHALMMLGITPFFEHFGDLPAVESSLAGRPLALDGLMHVVCRAHHAALYAHDWANLRHERRADEVAIAALLHDLAEILLWCFAPEMSMGIAAMLRANGSLRSSAAQSSVLGFKLADLQSALLAEWRLAALLRSLMDDAHATHPRVMNVALAMNLARHSAGGWDNPALPDDYAAIQQFLKLPLPQVLARIRRTALQAEAARDWYHREAVPIPVDLGNPSSGVQDYAKSDDS